ncbi:MAG TPA: ParB N-terminal domain-containing protein, partial [Streptosporangiaceae bacterium]
MTTADHPYQVMPPLADAEYEALKASIATGYDPARPVVVDETGAVLDGHHRQQACAELGIAPPTVVLPGLTEDQKHDYAMRTNLACRHLTQLQKRELIR